LEPSEKKKDLPAADYYRWLNQGCPIDDEPSNWLEAKMNVDIGMAL
jgi:hypothetical protein